MTSATTTPAARTRRRRAKGRGDGLVLVARVSADEKDNDPKVLLTYIAATLDAVHPAGDALASPVSSGARLGGAASGVGAGGDDRAGGAVRAGSMWAADPVAYATERLLRAVSGLWDSRRQRGNQRPWRGSLAADQPVFRVSCGGQVVAGPSMRGTS